MSTAMRPDRPLQKTDFLRNQFSIEGDEISLKSIGIIDERAKSGKCPAETEGDGISLKTNGKSTKLQNLGGTPLACHFVEKALVKSTKVLNSGKCAARAGFR